MVRYLYPQLLNRFALHRLARCDGKNWQRSGSGRFGLRTPPRARWIWRGLGPQPVRGAKVRAKAVDAHYRKLMAEMILRHFKTSQLVR